MNLIVNVHKSKTSKPAQKNEIQLKPSNKEQSARPATARPKSPCPKTTCPNSPHRMSSLSKRLIAERDIDPIINTERPSKQKDQQTIDKSTKQIKKSVQIDKENIAAKPIERKPSGKKSCCGKLIRNTPTDLFQKYQEDWIKYKHLLPGENSRDEVREIVRKKFQQPTDRKPKVSGFG